MRPEVGGRKSEVGDRLAITGDDYGGRGGAIHSSRTLTRRSSPLSFSPAFTLIELLVTVVILSTGIVVILQAFQTSMVALAESRDSMRSAALRHALIVQTELDVLGAGGSGGVTDDVLRERYPDFEWRVDGQSESGPSCTNAPWLKREVRVIVRHEVTGRESSADTILRVPVQELPGGLE